MERISDLEVKNITYGAEKRNAVVTFDSTIGKIRENDSRIPACIGGTVVYGKILDI